MESVKTIDLNAKIVRNTEIVSSKIDSDTVKMSFEMGEYYGTNPGGSLLPFVDGTPGGLHFSFSKNCPAPGSAYE